MILCTACGKLLDDYHAYASVGGNLVPYIPANFYHIGCVPTLKVESKPMTADDMLRNIISSLKEYPHGGGDIEVMREVDRIVDEAVKNG